MKICYWESKIRRRCEARVQRASDILREYGEYSQQMQNILFNFCFN